MDLDIAMEMMACILCSEKLPKSQNEVRIGNMHKRCSTSCTKSWTSLVFVSDLNLVHQRKPRPRVLAESIGLKKITWLYAFPLVHISRNWKEFSSEKCKCSRKSDKKMVWHYRLPLRQAGMQGDWSDFWITQMNSGFNTAPSDFGLRADIILRQVWAS